MRVKVGNTWYDSKDQPIAVELTDQDKKNIGLMMKDNAVYAEWQPTQFADVEACLQWMKEGSTKNDGR